MEKQEMIYLSFGDNYFDIIPKKSAQDIQNFIARFQGSVVYLFGADLGKEVPLEELVKNSIIHVTYCPQDEKINGLNEREYFFDEKAGYYKFRKKQGDFGSGKRSEDGFILIVAASDNSDCSKEND